MKTVLNTTDQVAALAQAIAQAWRPGSNAKEELALRHVVEAEQLHTALLFHGYEIARLDRARGPRGKGAE